MRIRKKYATALRCKRLPKKERDEKMKKKLYSTIAATAIALCAVGSVSADEDGVSPQDGIWTETIDGREWTYKITDGVASMGGGRGYVSLSYYPAVGTSTAGELVIPNAVYYSLCPVREIGEWAFRGCRQIESLTIPEGVNRICYGAFEDCGSLKTLVLPESLRDIGGFAVYGCRKLTSITIPEAVTNIGEKAFAFSDALAEIRIPSHVLSIGDCAFEGCGGLERIEVSPDNPNYTSVDGVLYDKRCTRLVWCPGKKTSVKIPSSVTEIPYYAFSENAYGLNDSLEKIEVEDGNEAFTSIDGVLYDKACTQLMCCPSRKKSVQIPQSVTRIGWSAFSGCTELTEVEIPSGVTEIGIGAFEKCINLTSVTIPQGVSNIEASVFQACYSLPKIDLPSGVTNIGASAFYGCSSLSGLVIPDGVRSIGGGAFEYCHALGVVRLPDSLISIGDEAFVYSWGLEKVLIGRGLESIGRWAFENCDELTLVTIPSSVTNIGYNAFYDCESLKTIYVDPGDEERVRGLLEASGLDTSALEFGEIVATPVINPGNGSTFDDDTCVVTITCETEGATIYYSTNGVTPRQSSRNLYNGPFVIDGSVEVVAFAARNGSVSDYAEAVITKVETPLTLASALDGKGFGKVSSGGSALWAPIKDALAKTGKSLARSGTISMNQESWLEMKVRGKGELMFWWKTSCEPDPRGHYAYDHLTFSSSEGDLLRLDGESGWRRVSVEFNTEGEHTVRWTYSTDDWEEPGYEDCGWLDGVEWTGEAYDESGSQPFVPGDPEAVVTGDGADGFVVRPSVGTDEITVSIPDGVVAGKVTVEVPTTAKSVAANGAAVKIVKVGGWQRYDITEYLRMPESDDGVLDVTKIEVRQQYADAALDFTAGARFDAESATPITTARTIPGLTYVLMEGRAIESLSEGDSTLGDGNAWQPRVSVRGGMSGFYRIRVTK